MTPDISDHAQDIPALGALSKCIGNHILVTHSAGGVTGWLSAMQNVEVKAVVAYEPGGFVFPEGEVPERIDGLTDGADGIPVPMNQFKRLTEIPIVLYFGDYIHTYYYDKSIADGYTCKLMREPVETVYKEKIENILDQLAGNVEVKKSDIDRTNYGT